eukprot:CAMPEP_0174293706 /NCGR_PEP_ID=MMETSP0809-20121228/39456_1 /TAXON_ID=73025 ORGANISM="Eutreptiella gymnastica-like, Strain CCMP1594" /NCGR_SAMPLE_ID=MMETSP0809 /ASSEMBLY_ACC=CAM_ASM_000658 /LENGTH=544 /DNA_ID=CAMNT_0015394691 /DNA_START=85 /DNA_END=1719 /DNA_ORIENTATION=-
MATNTLMKAPNPFIMPTDEEVFMLRDEERKKKAMEREKLQNRKVHEKTTWSNRIGSARVKARLIADDEFSTTKASDSMEYTERDQGKKSTSERSGYLPDMEVSKEKENMASFIAKKREMGLTRMSLSTKRHEIRKLEEESERAEKKIKQQEEQLEETIRKFEDFLKDNDMKAVEAMKKAEYETKGKQEKTAEIKKLSAQIAAITNEKTKNEEHMQFCLRYKTFLDQLTPESWRKDTLCNIEVRQYREELEKQLEEQLEAEPQDLEQVPDPAQVAAKQAAALAEVERKVEDTRNELKAKLEQLDDGAVKAELNVMDPDLVPMFFTDPEQILTRFMEIEEENLFLIQNCQETEESLEELKSKFTEAKQKMDEEAANLKSQIEQIKQKIGVEEQKKKILMARMATSKDAKNHEELVIHINTKVTEIFKASGFGDNDANINTLGMLTKIETKLEELRNQISHLPNDFKLMAMKQRDKERRQKARQKLLDEQRLLREERSQKALARSQAPVKKKVGKPVMWRSRPIDKKRTVVTDVADDGDMDDSEFFS